MAPSANTSRWVEARSGAVPWSPAKAALLVGVPLATIVITAGSWYGVDRIQDDLGDGTRADLDAAGIRVEDLAVDFDHRDGSISGILPAGVTVDRVRDVVDVDGIRRLDLTDLAETGATAVTDPPAPDPPPDIEEAAAEPAATDASASATVPETSTEPEPTDTAPPETTPPTDVEPDPDLDVDPDPDPDPDLDEDQDLDGDPNGVDNDAVDDEITALQVELDALDAEIRDDVDFESGEFQISEAGRAVLDKAVALIERYRLPVVQATGHTDNRGTQAFNEKLSGQRAAAVADYIVSQGVDASRIRSNGAGEAEPIADNSGSDGQAQNRRVELVALESFG